MSSEVTHRTVETNGIRMHLAGAGAGPLVVLCHGCPELWYSWRHQLPALAEAGFHAVAPDMRGYGRTDRPEAIDQYTLFHLVGDMVGLLDVLEAENAVIVGNDWGASVAWHAALMRPDRFRGVIGLSVPFRLRGQVRPTAVMPQTEDAVFYQLYYQTPGVAEAEFEHDVRRFIRGNLYSISGDMPATVPALYIAGDRDPVVSFPGMDRLIPNLADFVHSCAPRSCCPAVATGPSRSAQRRSTLQ